MPNPVYHRPIYYIYEHIDPKTKQIVYIGCGRHERAWIMPRHDHIHEAWIRRQYEKHGPGSWVRIARHSMLYTEACAVEAARIQAEMPLYNSIRRALSRPSRSRYVLGHTAEGGLGGR